MFFARRFPSICPGALGAPAAGPSYDADALAYFAALAVPAPDPVKTIVNDLVLALKAGGLWPKLGGFSLTAMHHEQAGRVDLRVPSRVAVAYNAPAFTAYRGWAGNGVDGYLDLGFTFSGSATYTQNSATFYEFTDAGTSTNESGSGTNGTGSTNRVYFTVPATGDETWRHNDNVADIFRAATGSPVGRRAAVREGAAIKRAYFNGALVADLTTPSANVPGGNATLFRRATAYSDFAIPVHAHGAGMTAAEISALDAAAVAAVSALKALAP